MEWRVTIALGVALGAKMANHDRTSNPGNPSSCIVGNSGASVERIGPVSAKALSLLALTNGSVEEKLPK
jgi:hypothetical protein